MNVQQILAALVLAVVLVLLLRELLGEQRRATLDRRARRSWHSLRTTLRSWRRAPQQRRDAAKAAAEAIRRARGAPDDGEWQGNVYTPKTFKKPRKPD